MGTALLEGTGSRTSRIELISNAPQFCSMAQTPAIHSTLALQIQPSLSEQLLCTTEWGKGWRITTGTALLWEILSWLVHWLLDCFVLPQRGKTALAAENWT